MGAPQKSKIQRKKIGDEQQIQDFLQDNFTQKFNLMGKSA